MQVLGQKKKSERTQPSVLFKAAEEKKMKEKRKSNWWLVFIFRADEKQDV